MSVIPDTSARHAFPPRLRSPHIDTGDDAGRNDSERNGNRVEEVPAFNPGAYSKYGKPCLDAVLAAVALMVVSPVLVAVGLAVLLTCGSPVLYKQQRVGRHGRPFTVLKFRTMAPDRRAGDQPITHPCRRLTHKSSTDPRHTPLGRVLRKYSLDELPQLVNVLRGQMSLVGPRPELPSVASRYGGGVHARRHQVRPGLTGLWQVTARGEGAMHEHVELDLQYVDQLSFRTDLRILLATPVALLSRPGG